MYASVTYAETFESFARARLRESDTSDNTGDGGADVECFDDVL